MNDSQLMHAMSLDDTYRVEQVLARGEDGITELVTIDGAGPFAMFGRHSPNAARLASPESRPPTSCPSTLLSYTISFRVNRFPSVSSKAVR